jgi:hypothetical protein
VAAVVEGQVARVAEGQQRMVFILIPLVTPQNRDLADYSDQATIYMMSL